MGGSILEEVADPRRPCTVEVVVLAVVSPRPLRAAVRWPLLILALGTLGVLIAFVLDRTSAYEYGLTVGRRPCGSWPPRWSGYCSWSSSTPCVGAAGRGEGAPPSHLTSS